MIDLHHHCLPGIDDGPDSWEEAVDLCRMAADEGVGTIVATPHVLRGRWPVFTPAELKQKLDTLREKVGDSPRLLLGSEYFFAHDICEELAAGNRIVPLAGGHYVLVEFASNAIPPLIEQPFYRLQLEGWTPIIAHPERNIVFQSHPELLARLIEHGARTQITAASFLGDFGNTARKVAEEWLKAGMVHIVATDSHNTSKRPPRAKAAMDALRELAGEDFTNALTYDNPLAVIEDRPLPFDPEPEAAPPRRGLFTEFKRFIGLS
ncbi:MAG TPA: CpsB/CapC family capsule biosynthesis tyrosine phosphatase [Thermoanaerobaculia bacterium]|nr:CpsB/CapC family capsule biosynthesis tyrosine phosphatase [Thermoanaerobaculia bacterium]